MTKPTVLKVLGESLWVQREKQHRYDLESFGGPVKEGADPKAAFVVCTGVIPMWVCSTRPGAFTKVNELLDKHERLDFEVLSFAEYITRVAEQAYDRGFVGGLLSQDNPEDNE